VTPLNQLATRAYDAERTYDQVVHFVHVYIIEPHPEGDPGPYSGGPSEREYSAGHPQPRTFPDRLAYAQQMLPEIQGDQQMLIDDLTPGRQNNPAWCTYGPCPNCAFLIRPDGIIDTVQTWADAGAMQTAIDALMQ